MKELVKPKKPVTEQSVSFLCEIDCDGCPHVICNKNCQLGCVGSTGGDNSTLEKEDILF